MKGIGIIGADGTGKTTLLQAIKDAYGNKIRTIEGVSRGVISDGYPLGKAANKDSYIELIRRQIDKLMAASRLDVLFISDRTLLDAYCYAVVNSTLPRPYINQEFIDFLRSVWLLESTHYSCYLRIPIEFSLQPDGIRDPDVQYQRSISAKFDELVSILPAPVYSISGTIGNRTDRAIEIIAELLP